MALPLPRLDDRDYNALLADALAIIRQRSPGWTDLSPGDPGITLLETFAYLTDVLLYSLNRIPEKVHVALLNLLGITMRPPSAAVVTLRFDRSGDLSSALTLPAGLQVSDTSGAILFTLQGDLMLAPGVTQVEHPAINAELIEGEILGTGTGLGRQSVALRRPPVLRGTETGVDLDTLFIGVEANADDARTNAIARQLGGKAFLAWTEARSFTGLGAEDRAFLADRATGLITFAPLPGPGGQNATFLPVPGKGMQIRAWYWRGGGRAGNVTANTLTVLRAQVQGVTVTNPGRAAGGEDGETIEQAVRRAEEMIGVLRTAVTAPDFEHVARAAGGISRAQAYAQRDRWSFGEPGLVEVQLVPRIEPEALVSHAVTPEVLAAHQTPELLRRVDVQLATRRPLGIRTAARWTRCRPVAVIARVVVSPVEAVDAVRDRLMIYLNDRISPASDWQFGRMLRASDVYDVLLREPGVRYIEDLRLTIEVGPTASVRRLAADPNDDRSVFAATGTGLFRSLDFGRSWTLQQDGLPEPQAVVVRHDPRTPGQVAAVVENAERTVSTICVSRDAGENWIEFDRLQSERVYDAAWVSRDGRSLLMVATEQALRRLPIEAGQGSVNIERLLRSGDTRFKGFFAIASTRHPSGISFVALAAREEGGVLMSVEGSEPRSFQLLAGSVGKDVRVLAFQREEDRTFLWAGISAVAGAVGEGLMRIEARADGDDPVGWIAFSKGWRGGSCRGIAFAGRFLMAATAHAGVLYLDLDAPPGTQIWQGPGITCGLPINDERSAIEPVSTVVARLRDDGSIRILAGTEQGIFESMDKTSYRATGQTVFVDQVPLPAHWLYCSGPHELTVVREQAEVDG